MVIKVGIDKGNEKTEKSLPDYSAVTVEQKGAVTRSLPLKYGGGKILCFSITLNVLLFIGLTVALVFVFKGSKSDTYDGPIDHVFSYDDYMEHYPEKVGSKDGNDSKDSEILEEILEDDEEEDYNSMDSHSEDSRYSHHSSRGKKHHSQHDMEKLKEFFCKLSKKFDNAVCDIID